MASLSEQGARQSSRRGWPDYAAIAVAMCLLWLTILGFVGLPRILFAAAFTFFVPGRAVVINWPQLERWSPFAMSMALSLAVLTVIATVALWAHVWHPIGILQLETAVSTAAIVAALARRNEGVRNTVSNPFRHRRDVSRL